MNDLRISIAADKTAFEPRAVVAGTASWSLDHTPRTVELRLFWFTRGKGTEDAGVVETIRFSRPQPEETRPFRFLLPDSPLSFSGKLISLVWALELVAEPSKAVARTELVIAPGAQEVRLESLPKVPSKFLWFSFTA